MYDFVLDITVLKDTIAGLKQQLKHIDATWKKAENVKIQIRHAWIGVSADAYLEKLEKQKRDFGSCSASIKGLVDDLEYITAEAEKMSLLASSFAGYVANHGVSGAYPVVSVKKANILEAAKICDDLDKAYDAQQTRIQEASYAVRGLKARVFFYDEFDSAQKKIADNINRICSLKYALKKYHDDMALLEKDVCARFNGTAVVSACNSAQGQNLGLKPGELDNKPLLSGKDIEWLQSLFYMEPRPHRALELRLGLRPGELDKGSIVPGPVSRLMEIWEKEPDPNRVLEREFGLRPGELRPLSKEEADSFAETCLKLIFIGPAYTLITGYSLVTGEEASQLKALSEIAEVGLIYYTLWEMGGRIEPGTCKYSDAEINKILDDIKGDGFKNDPLRQAYEKEVSNLANTKEMLLLQGKSEEETAKALHKMRRDLGIKYKDATPQPLRDYIYDININRYGDPLGPSFEKMSETKTYAEIITSSYKPNISIDDLLSGFEQWLRRQ